MDLEVLISDTIIKLTVQNKTAFMDLPRSKGFSRFSYLQMSFSLLLLSFGVLSSLFPAPTVAIPTAEAAPAAQQDEYEPPSIKRALIRVDVSKTYQTFDGMGFSEAFQRSRIIYGSDGLSPRNTERVLALLFSNTTGAGLTILRHGIGSSTNNPYDLMKSIAPISPGSPSAKSSYEWDGDDNGQVRLTKDAIARGAKTIYADAWSAPGYMKNNSNDSNGGSLCGVRGVNCTSGDWRTAYANYLVQYLRLYEQEGIHVDHVGFLNEPDLKYVSLVGAKLNV
jgi:O-glycosyl hydrolase